MNGVLKVIVSSLNSKKIDQVERNLVFQYDVVGWLHKQYVKP